MLVWPLLTFDVALLIGVATSLPLAVAALVVVVDQPGSAAHCSTTTSASRRHAA